MMKNNKNKFIKRSISFLLVITVSAVSFSCIAGQHTNTASNSGSTDRIKKSMINSTPANEHNQKAIDTIKKDTTKYNTAGMDAAFLMKAAEISMEEIKLSLLAQQKGTMLHVKNLGKMIVTDHTQALEEIVTLSKAKAVNISFTESDKIRESYNSLNAKSGKDFDKSYSDLMVSGLKEAIALFEEANVDTKDSDIRATTSKMLPTLKKHLEQAEICQKECSGM